MSKQYHLVVCCDLDTGEMWIDPDTTEAKFRDEVWDSESENWIEIDSDLADLADLAYARLRDAVQV